MSLLFRSSRRHLLRHPWQIGLSVLGVAVAVAVVVGVDLANAGARRGFELSVEGVAGRATHEVAGGPTGVPEELYRRLRVDAGVRRSAPVVEGWVASDRLPGRGLRLFGVDPFAEATFRSFTRTLGGGDGDENEDGDGDLGRFLTEPGAVLVAPELAAELGVAVDDDFEVTAGGRRHRLRLVAFLEPADQLARRSARDLLVVDVATAQELLGRAGRLTRIDLVLDGEEAEKIRRLLPAGVELRTKSGRSGALEQMTRAFRLNLQALSLLALLVGTFLIYNTMTFSVVQRRPLLGTLRALGVTRRQLFAVVLAEAAVVAAAGSAAGVGLGVLLGRGLLELVARTINDLYFALSVTGVGVPLVGLVKGVLLGVAGTLLATLPAAREAATATPRAVLLRSQLERRARRSLPRLTAAGVAALALTAGLLAVPSKSLPLAFAAVFVFVLACACLVPPLLYAAMQLLRPPIARIFGILGSLAARGVAGTLSRTGVAVAALVIAVAMTAGVALMVRSFRATLVDWLETTLQADVYVAPAGVSGRGVPSALDPELIESVRALPEVGRLTTSRRVEVGSETGPTQLQVVDLDRPAFDVFTLVDGDADEVWRRFQEGAVLVSEPYAYHRDLAVGDHVVLLTDRGPRSFEIAGVYYDYATDRGVVLLSRRSYDRFWDDPAVQSLGLYAAPGVGAEELAEAVRRAAGAGAGAGGEVADGQRITVAVNREIRRSALEIFDRTFVITGVLRLLSVIVAVIGILSALMALQLERSRELGVLRANGLTPAQLWGLVTTQTGLMGLVAGLLAAPVGVALATLLVHVINRRSFGWTLRLEIAPDLLLQTVLLALAAALLAGLYPAWKMSRSSPALALREE